MVKLRSLLVGLAVVVGMRAGPRATAATPSAVMTIAAMPPLYATRDIFSALGAPRP